MNRLTVKINGIEYALKGEEKEEYLLELANHVDKKLKSIMDINPRLDTTSAAVLTAVNTIDEVFKQKRAYERIEKEKEELNKNQIIFNEELGSLKKQLADMELSNQELKEKLKNSTDDAELQLKDEIIKELKESLKSNLKELDQLRYINKEMKFQNQSAKYKILDLQQKLEDSQIGLAKAKKQGSDTNNYPVNKKRHS